MHSIARQKRKGTVLYLKLFMERLHRVINKRSGDRETTRKPPLVKAQTAFKKQNKYNRVSTDLTEQISRRFPGYSMKDFKKNPGHVCIVSARYVMYRMNYI